MIALFNHPSIWMDNQTVQTGGIVPINTFLAQEDLNLLTQEDGSSIDVT